MPLMAELPPGMAAESDQVQLDAAESKIELKEEREETDSRYEDYDAFDQDLDDSDMDGSILHRTRPKKVVKTPAVPPRSEMRASNVLENVLVELKSLDGSVTTKESEPQSIVSDPHELYLSSEEDASFSDDYGDEDSLIDFEATPSEDGGNSKPSSRASSRRSQEDTARVVSFTVVTKPQIIQIVIPPPAALLQKRLSMNLDALTSSLSTLPQKSTRRPSPLNLYNTSLHRLSVSSSSTPVTSTSTSTSYIPASTNTFTHHANQSLTSLPPRRSSKFSNISSLMSNAKNTFLVNDPFADTKEEDEEGDEVEMPKTPTRMFMKGLSRTMSKARKPSMQMLSLAYTAGIVPKGPLEETKEVVMKDTECEDAKGASLLVNETKENGKEREKERSVGFGSRVMGFGLGRRKSVKGRGERYTG